MTSTENTTLELFRSDLNEIRASLAIQAELEAERAGANKFMSRLIAVFGSLMTAAIVGTFTWAWNANALAVVQSEQMRRIVERHADHASLGGHVQLQERQEETSREVLVLTQQYQALSLRFQRQEALLQQSLTELRRRR